MATGMVDGAPLGGHTVMVVQRDESGDGDWTDTGRIPVAGCSVQPDPATENDVGRQQTVQGFCVFGPPELAVAQGADQLEVPGWLASSARDTVRLEMTGPASTLPDEDGHPHHVEITARLVTG